MLLVHDQPRLFQRDAAARRDKELETPSLQSRKWPLLHRLNMSPQGLRDISAEQWLFGAFSAADSTYGAIQEMVNVQRGSESCSNQLNSFLQGGEVGGPQL